MKRIADNTVEFSRKFPLGTLEALEEFLFDEVLAGNPEDEASWLNMEEFRKEAPNADKFTVFFTYGNGTFWVEVQDGQFDKISFDTDFEEIEEELATLLEDFRVQCLIGLGDKERLAALENEGTEIDIF